ncbi:ComF family protein [Stutzerimonas stutzeri]|uniref:ComF family protein n=1 Tax=Stutzerimonas stutzeri TaxID=316 RepID=A0AA42HAS4_STUST|nr:ComF family protein [Stutzerimonas stutzeri]MDH0147405.1 ComF family protein [Stutzerimonas stutzeri]MDH0151599.1 ComF family protein [Stutzerimonas stutzeri]MDH0609380.1 ComF family protein [Stutzerimonas stutzeri]GBC58520.1 competence protein F homolog, phosphoribosyltransferase domain; protein YhgH required for utilization of DNA as sole source of carbon and energy [Stutzerimonas stutzeri]
MVYNWSIIEHHCLLCDERCEGQPLCSPCEADLPWLDGRCTVCAVPLPSRGLVCGECLKRPPSYDHVEVPWRFAFPVDALITRFKHQARWPYGRLLGERLAHHLEHAFADGLPRPDLLLPVPLARRRLRQRGFNQAQMLADWLSRPLGIATDARVLDRVLDTLAQQQLDAATRRRNLRQAFAIATAADVKGRHLALVDDVLTTGATAEALARLLKRAGAERVDVYCLARTPKPGE